MVGDKKRRRCFHATTEDIALEKNMYTVSTGDDPNFMEKIWGAYETGLASAIDQLIQGTLDAVTWLGVLVPFVTSLLVRGRDFDERFAERMKLILPENADIDPIENTNSARMIELQRLLAPILAAHWIIAEAQGAGSLITSDVAYAGFRAPEEKTLGLAIPLGRRHALQLIPCRKRPVVVAKGDTWLPVLDYRRMSPGNHRQFNIVMTGWAKRFIFGPDDEAVCPHLKAASGREGPVPEPYAFGFIGEHLGRVHEFTWHYLMSAVVKPPEARPTWGPQIDWEAIASVWKLMAIIPLNPDQRWFPAGLLRDEDKILVDLYDVDKDAQLLNRPSVVGFALAGEPRYR